MVCAARTSSCYRSCRSDGVALHCTAQCSATRSPASIDLLRAYTSERSDHKAGKARAPHRVANKAVAEQVGAVACALAAALQRRVADAARRRRVALADDEGAVGRARHPLNVGLPLHARFARRAHCIATLHDHLDAGAAVLHAGRRRGPLDLAGDGGRVGDSVARGCGAGGRVQAQRHLHKTRQTL